jgi:hypothetical protein
MSSERSRKRRGETGIIEAPLWTMRWGRPLAATLSALRSPTDEDKVTIWTIPAALGRFAPRIPMMEAAQSRH